jgi:pimeloyl-ACP methyl ester carboxylesterase
MNNVNAEIAPRRGSFEGGPVRLSYLEWGEAGRPLLLLHGITGCAEFWWRLAPDLVREGYHVFAADMPGHGHSGDSDDHRIPQIARSVGALLTMPALAGATLVGHSWGGATALTIAAGRHDGPLPARVVLIDPPLQLSPESGEPLLPGFSANLGLRPEQLLPLLRAAHPGWAEGDLRAKAAALSLCRIGAVRGLLLQSGSWDLVSLLAEVPVPLLLLVSDPAKSAIRPQALAAARLALRPSLGKIVVLPGADHSPFRAPDYDAFTQALLLWLREQP